MKPITESFVNQHLRRAAETLTPHKAEELWEQPVEKAAGDEWYLDGARPQKRRTGRTIGIFSSLAACVAVCFLSLYMVNFRVDATVYLDVNPSITIQVNCSDKVIRAQANNPDGEIILEGMELKNTGLNAAVNAVIGSMVRHGYLTEAKNVVLLSVSSGSEEKTESLRTRLSGEINDCLTSLVGSGTVFDQEVELDEELEEFAEKYGITPGKAALIRRAVEAHPEMDYDTLARLSMEELTGYLTASGADIRDYVNHSGTPFDSFDSDDDSDNADKPDDLDLDDDPANTGEPDDLDLDDDPANTGEPEDLDLDDDPANANEPEDDQSEFEDEEIDEWEDDD